MEHSVSSAHAPNQFNLRSELAGIGIFHGGRGGGKPERGAPVPLTRNQGREMGRAPRVLLRRGREEETGHGIWPRRGHW